MLTYYDYYLAQRERTLSMSSAPRSGQAAAMAAASVAGGWWQLAGGWCLSRRAGSGRGGRLADGWLGQIGRRAVGRAVRRAGRSAAAGRFVAGAWREERQAIGGWRARRRRLGGRFGGDSAGGWAVGGWRLAGGGVL